MKDPNPLLLTMAGNSGHKEECIEPPADPPERRPGESKKDWKERVKAWRKAWKEYEKCLKGR